LIPSEISSGAINIKEYHYLTTETYVQSLEDDEEGVTRSKTQSTTISFVAETLLPTIKGNYRIRAYKDTSKENNNEIIVIIWGKVEDGSDIPCRVHDQCFTSEVLGSLKCDCREQLDWAMEYIKDVKQNKAGMGMIIYLPQEGRGIGLANKIKAYSMQEIGFDTVDANRILGFADDLRDYSCVPAILAQLGIKSIALMTNNPRKSQELQQLGVSITSRIPILIEANPHSDAYLKAKKWRMGHLS